MITHSSTASRLSPQTRYPRPCQSTARWCSDSGYDPCRTVPFVCWRDPLWYRDRVGRREPAVPWVPQAVPKRGTRRPCHRNPNGHQGRQARIQRNRVRDEAPPSTFVGIDVAKHSLDVRLRPSGEHFTVDHSEEEVAALVARLAAHGPTLVVLEATGGMEVRLAAAPPPAGPPAAAAKPRPPAAA